MREAVQGNGPVDKTGTAPWTDFTTHTSTAIRHLVAARDWLHVIQLPAYAPDLNPTDSVWSHVKHSLGNLAVTNVEPAGGYDGLVPGPDDRVMAEQ